MSTFSLLQITLDPPIERDSFLHAATGGVPRADLDRHYRDLYGVVISNLPREEALKLQAQLNQRNFPTELVADEDVPVLPLDFQMQRLDIEGEWLRFTDSMGRESLRALDDLVFISGGLLTDLKLRPEDRVISQSSSKERSPRVERTYRPEEIAEFRIEFFFLSDPYRLKLSLTETSTIFFQKKPLRLQMRGPLYEAVTSIAALLPSERLSVGMLDPEKRYPSVKAYLEEIRWHFYQLRKTG